MTTLVSVENVSVDYPGLRALDAVSLEIRRGDVLAVVGANGSGKTTLLNVLTGQRLPTSGSVTVRGRALTRPRPVDALALGVVLVPQEPLMATTLPGWENLLLGTHRLLGRAPSRDERERARSRMRDALPHVDPDAPVAELRKGDRAILGLERAMMAEPVVLALDEPTAVLGEHGVELVDAATKTVRNRGGAVVLVSHRLKDIVRLATRVAVLVDGRLVLDRNIAEVSIEEIVDTLAAGRGLEVESRTSAQRTPGRELLSVSTTREASGLDIDDLTVHEGEIVGVVGMAGSGRSRLCKLVAGAQGRPEGVRFLGADLPRSTRASRRAGIAFIPEDRLAEGVFPALSVSRNIELSDVIRRSLARFLPPSPRRSRVSAAIARFGIKTPSPDVDVTALSGGNAQRVVIARELGNEPRLVVADEPTQGVDRTGRAAIHDLLRGYAADRGGVLLVSSDFEELQELADRLYVLVDGALIAEVPVSTPYSQLLALASGVTSTAPSES